MYKLDEFKQLVKDFSDVADFLVIYIAEAHSTGEYKLFAEPEICGWRHVAKISPSKKVNVFCFFKI